MCLDISELCVHSRRLIPLPIRISCGRHGSVLEVRRGRPRLLPWSFRGPCECGLRAVSFRVKWTRGPGSFLRCVSFRLYHVDFWDFPFCPEGA